MTEKQPEQPSPLDKARQLIDKESQQKRSAEEIAEREEGARLEDFYSEVKDLYDKLAEVRKGESAAATQSADLGVKIQNITHGEKQAMGTLKSHKDTSEYFSDKGKEENLEEFHSERREKFTQVFGDAQNEKRGVKKERKQKLKDKNTANQEESGILDKIEKLKKSPDWVKATENKKMSLLEADKKYKDFYYNKEKSKQASLYAALNKVNTFSGKYEKNINELKGILEKDLTELLAHEQNVFRNAQQSKEYEPAVFGKIDFQKYLDLLPKNMDEFTFSIYSRDQGTITFPSLGYDSPLGKELIKDIDETEEGIKIAEKEINERTGFFSGRGKFEKQKENLKKKVDFLRKIRDSADHHVNEFNRKHLPALDFSDHGYDLEHRKTYGYTVGRYVDRISSEAHPIADAERTFPEFKRTTTLQDLFRWAKKNDIPLDWQAAHREAEEMREKIAKQRKEYELLAGDGAVGRLHL